MMMRGLLDEMYSRSKVPKVASPAGLLAPAAAAMQAPASAQQGASWADFAKLSGLDQVSNVRSPVGAMNGLGAAIGFTGPATVAGNTQGEWNEASGSYNNVEGFSVNPELAKALDAYRFQRTSEEAPTVRVSDSTGASLGDIRYGDPKGAAMKIAGTVIPALVMSGFGAGLGTLFGPGAGAAAGGGDALASAPSFFDPGASFLGESVGAAPAWSPGIAGGLAPAEVGSGFLGGGSFMGESVAPAFSMPTSAPSFFDPGASFLGEAVPQAQPMGTNPLEAWNPQPAAPIEASFTAPQAMPPVPQAPTSAPSFFDQGSSFLGEPVQPAQPMAQNPLTPWDVQPTAPIEASFTAPPSLPQATTFEELRAAEHADMGQGTGNIPKTVNMGELGGTTGTAGGLQGAYDVATQMGSDALTSVAGPAGDVASWMKSNPQLGKLLMSGAMGLLSGSSAGSSGSAAPKVYGPAQQWSSPIQQGLLGNPQQMNPAAIQQRPQGLLAQGQQYDGAWRYMGGK